MWAVDRHLWLYIGRRGLDMDGIKDCLLVCWEWFIWWCIFHCMRRCWVGVGIACRWMWCWVVCVLRVWLLWWRFLMWWLGIDWCLRMAGGRLVVLCMSLMKLIGDRGWEAFMLESLLNYLESYPIILLYFIFMKLID